MSKHLYHTFLTDKEVYKKNVTFWHNVVQNLLAAENYTFSEYVATSDGKGNEFYNGNPIYNFKIDRLNKGVRIIQEEPEESDIMFSAWIDQTTLVNDEKIDELVISLELTQETVYLAVDVIQAWIINDFTPFRMKRYLKTISQLQKQVHELV